MLSEEKAQQLWTSHDIAKVLEIGGTVVTNWHYYGRDYMPQPFAVTQSGTKLWSAEQAKQIIASYYQRQAEKQERRAVKERAKRMIEHLGAP